ncbi:SDR family oxidoreductase [uncultured Desulfosarcina sp.]|uniref:SDR family oxidoreductase n=1 Tax=uncultured Desulfosarcina sp. TaxID=218289 RepID=UPI0029C7A4DD|nr:SDR family oxidoreductase [uncultured Desulfosarcina sp.]
MAKAPTDIPTTVKNKNLVEKRRRQIILAAIKLFSQKGFHKTTLKELAEEAGLSHGNVYDYVGSKEDIFFLIHDFLAGSAMEILNRGLENIQDPIDKLRRMVRGEFNLMDQWADALLLIYQESHILKRDFLRRLLEKERAHVEKFELVIQEGIAQGQLRQCNVRLTANLIKSMIDAWTIKRWDLRAHASQLEAERSILEMVFHGMLTEQNGQEPVSSESDALTGKTALVVNGGTVLGQGICAALVGRGIRVITHVCDETTAAPFPVLPDAEKELLTVIRSEDAGRMTGSMLKDIKKQHGPIDIYLHDLGVGTTEVPDGEKIDQIDRRLEENLGCAHELADYFSECMGARTSGRIVFVAPWRWDKHAAPIRFETVKAGTMALSSAMSAKLAAAGVNVNCIVPGFIRAVRPLKIEKALKHEVIDEIPSGRLGEIYDVTDAILFLIGDASKYLTGQTLNISGGL